MNTDFGWWHFAIPTFKVFIVKRIQPSSCSLVLKDHILLPWLMASEGRSDAVKFSKLCNTNTSTHYRVVSSPLPARGKNEIFLKPHSKRWKLVLQCKPTLYFHLTENGNLSNCAASFLQKSTTLSYSKNLIKLKLQTSYQMFLLMLNKNTVFQKHKKYFKLHFCD